MSSNPTLFPAGAHVRVRPSDPVPGLRGRSGRVVLSPLAALDQTLATVGDVIPLVDFGVVLLGAAGVRSRVHPISARHIELIPEQWFSCSCGAMARDLGVVATVREDGGLIDLATCPACGELAIAERQEVAP